MRESLEKRIGKFDIFALALGAIIGWGSFILPGDLFLSKIGFKNASIGLFLGALLMVIIEKNYGFMLSKCAVSGGEYAFTYKVFGRVHALICAWFLGLAYIAIVPLNATALSLIAKVIFPGLLERGFLYTIAGYDVYIAEVLVASFALLFFAYINIKGIEMASLFQKIMTLGLIGIVVSITAFLFMTQDIESTKLMSHFTSHNIEFGKIMKIFTIAPFIYIGFDCIPQAAEEFNFPAKQASKLAILSIVFGFGIYMMLNIITAFGYTQSELLSGNIGWAAGNSAQMMLGKAGLYLLAIALLMAIVAGINGFYMAASRVLFALGRAKALSPWFVETDDKSKMPKNAIKFIMGMSLLAPWFGRGVLLWIVDMSSIGAVIGYFYTSFAAYKLAKIDNKLSIKITGAIGTFAGLMFVALLLWPGLETTLSKPSYIALGIWSLLGVVFYIKQGEKYRAISKIKLDKLILDKTS